ncbi:MAG: sulfatase [Vulcanimicrobiota bacterium]
MARRSRCRGVTADRLWATYQQGWPPLSPARRQAGRLSQSRAELRFYLTHPLDLKLGLQAQGRPGQARVLLNGKPLAELAVGKEWNRLQTRLAAADLRAGQNTLQLGCPDGTSWDALQLVVADEGQGFGEPLTQTRDEQGRVLIPYGHSLEFPLERAYQRLQIKLLEAWNEPGAPPASDWKLHLSLDQQHWETNAPGTISLPAYRPPAMLRLQASLAQPAPGQLGLRCQASLQAWQTQPEKQPPPPSPPSDKQRASIVLYVIDALRADGLGCFNPSVHNTPHLDALARDSVVYTQANAQSSWTKPAMASILSGQLPVQHGAEDEADQVPAQLSWLPLILQQAGYKTASFSANPLIQECFGFARGFDAFQNWPETDALHLNRLAREWLPGQAPFFLYLHCLEPHSPYRPARGARELDFDQVMQDRTLLPALRANYGSEIARNDEALGQLVDYLKEQKIYDFCLLIVVADHGEEFLEHGQLSHANSLYQELIHIPLIIKFPGQLGAGTTIDGITQQIDLAPTMLRAAGIKAPEGMAGLALGPGQSPPSERPIFFSVGLGRPSLVPRRRSPRVLEMRGVRLGPWVLTQTRAANRPCPAPAELFNLDRDPAEKHNLWAAEPGYRALLTGLLQTRLVPSGARAAQAPWSDTEKALRTLNYLR